MTHATGPALFIALALAAVATGCSERGQETLTSLPAKPNPTGPAERLEDVAAWSDRERGIETVYVAAGPRGLDVHRADGSHLQRLGSTPAAFVVLLEGMAVDHALADFIVTVDPDARTFRGFEIHGATGGLRRIARSRGNPLETVTALCSYRAADGSQRLIMATAEPALIEWSLSAVSGKIRGRANEIVSTQLRRATLAAGASDCAVDARTGAVLLLDAEGRLRRIAGRWGDTVVPERVPGQSGAPLRGIAIVAREARPAVLLATTSDGRVRALTPAGEKIGEIAVDIPGRMLSAEGSLLAFVDDARTQLRLAPLAEALRLLGVSRERAR